MYEAAQNAQACWRLSIHLINENANFTQSAQAVNIVDKPVRDPAKFIAANN